MNKLREILKDREACCSPWGCKESDTTERLKNNNNLSPWAPNKKRPAPSSDKKPSHGGYTCFCAPPRPVGGMRKEELQGVEAGEGQDHQP